MGLGRRWVGEGEGFGYGVGFGEGDGLERETG